MMRKRANAAYLSTGNKRSRRMICAAVCGAGLTVALQHADGATYWYAGPTNGSLNSAGNWSGSSNSITAGAIPGSGDTAVIGYSGYNGGTLTLDAGQSFNGLQIGGTHYAANMTSGVTINTGASPTNTLTIGAGGLLMAVGSSPGVTFNAPVYLAASQSWTKSAAAGGLSAGGGVTLNNLSGASGASISLSGGGYTLNGPVNLTGDITLNGDGFYFRTFANTVSYNNLNINSTGAGGGYYFGSNALTGATGTISIGNNTTFGMYDNTTASNAYALTGVSYWYTPDGARTVVLNGAVTGGTVNFYHTGSLTLGGSANNTALTMNANSGTLILNKASSSTVHAINGGLTVNSGGFVQLSGTGGDQIADAASLAVNTGGSLDMNGNSETAGALSGGGTITNSSLVTSTTLTISSNSNSDFSGQLKNAAGGLSVVKTGTGTQTFSGTNTYSGSTAVMNGTLATGSSLALPSSTNVTLGSTGNSATLDLKGSSVTISGLAVAGGATAASQTIGSSSNTVNASLTVNTSGGSSAFGGVIKDQLTGNTTKTLAVSVTGGTGNSLTVTGANTYTGGTTIAANTTLQVGDGTTTGSITGAVTNNGNLTFNNPAATSTPGVISGSGSLTKSGAGVLAVNQVHTYTGATVITNGTVQLYNTQILPATASASPTLRLDASTLSTTNGSSVNNVSNSGSAGGTFTNAPTIVENSTNYTPTLTAPTFVSSGINGKGSLQFTSTSASAGQALGYAGTASGGNSAIIASSNTLTIFVVEKQTAVPPALGGNNRPGLVSLVGNTSSQDDASGSGGVALNLNNTDNAFQTRRNGGAVTQLADHSAANSFDSRTFVVSTVFNGSTDTLSAIYNNSGVVGSIANATNPSSSTGNFNINAAIIGARLQTPTTSYGTLSYAYTGQIGEVLIYSGALNAADQLAVQNYLTNKWLGITPSGYVNGALPTSTPLQLNTGATLDLNGVSQAVASIADYSGGATGTVTSNYASGTSTITLNATSGTTTFSGTIQNGSGTVGLTKSGTGSTQILAGTNTYTGATLITGGTLKVNGSLAAGSAVTVASGGTLGGSGNVAGSVTVNSGGTIAPGNSVGTINTGSLTENGNFVAEIDFAGGVGTADQINVTGSVNITGGALVLSFSNGADFAGPYTFVLINNDSSDAITGNFASIVPANGAFGGLIQYTTSTTGGTGNDYSITITAVPEPTAASTMLLGGLFMLRRNRRRK